MGSSPADSSADGRLSGTDSACNSLSGNGRESGASGMSSASDRTKQLTWFAGEIPALAAPWPKGIDKATIPTSPDTSLPWLVDRAHGGWSARIFVHQMLRTSQPDWSSSDTELLLSRSTLGISQVRVAGGRSLSDALLTVAPHSPELYLTPQMVLGLASRAEKRRRPLQRVFLRTRRGWRRRTLTVSSRDGAFVFSLPKNAKPCKGSPEAGLMDFLEAAVEPCSATRSRSRSKGLSE